MFVGRDWTLVMRDLRTLIYLLNLELREECIGPGHRAWAGVQYAIGEQQPKRTQLGEQQLKRAQSGSSSWRRRQTASSSAAIGEQQLEAEANGEQHCRNRAREQQQKRTQAASSMQLKRTQSGRSSSSELSGAGLRTVGDKGGSS